MATVSHEKQQEQNGSRHILLKRDIARPFRSRPTSSSFPEMFTRLSFHGSPESVIVRRRQSYRTTRRGSRWWWPMLILGSFYSWKRRDAFLCATHTPGRGWKTVSWSITGSTTTKAAAHTKEFPNRQVKRESRSRNLTYINKQEKKTV